MEAAEPMLALITPMILDRCISYRRTELGLLGQTHLAGVLSLISFKIENIYAET